MIYSQIPAEILPARLFFIDCCRVSRLFGGKIVGKCFAGNYFIKRVYNPHHNTFNYSANSLLRQKGTSDIEKSISYSDNPSYLICYNEYLHNTMWKSVDQALVHIRSVQRCPVGAATKSRDHPAPTLRWSVATESESP